MLLLATHPIGLEHDTGPGHPERPARLTAVLDGVADASHHVEVREIDVGPVPLDELGRVHGEAHVDRIRAAAARGDTWLDGDTHVSTHSFDAALVAAGAGLAAVDALAAGQGAAAFVVVRPPGHHAGRDLAGGFCLFNNIAVAAAHLTAGGQRVAIVDWDVHHGNGTQAIFWDDADVLYISLHEARIYPGTGDAGEAGGESAFGATLNIPLPAGATGDVYRHAFDSLVAPAVRAFDADWLLVSAGFDAHRDDPLASLALSAGDYGDLAQRVAGLAPEGRVALFLEGGYDLDALRRSSAAAVGGLLGGPCEPELPSHGGPGHHAVDRVAAWWPGPRA